MVHQVLDNDGDSSPTFVGRVTTTPMSNRVCQTFPAEPIVPPTSDSGWHIKLKINDQELTWCVNTGAQVSVTPESVYKESCGKLSKPDRELVEAGDVPLTTVGFVIMNLVSEDKAIAERVYIVKGASKLPLVIPAIRGFGLIHQITGTYSIKAVHHTPRPAGNNPVPLSVKDHIVKKYPMLFQGLGNLEGEHTIHLKEGTTPFCLTTPRRVPLSLMKNVKEEIERMLQLDVIEPVDESTERCSPIVVVPKADGRVRICVDLTKLNQAVRREVYQMPTTEETLGSLTEGSVFSKLDANSGFHQIVLNPESAKRNTLWPIYIQAK